MGLDSEKVRIHVTIRGVVQLMRPVPLAIWSLPTVGFGFLMAGTPIKGAWLSLTLAMFGAILLQGVIAHGLNDLYDWQSGTDQNTEGVISGGSKVLKKGLLNEAGIWRTVYVCVVLYAIVSIILSLVRGKSVLLWAVLGLSGSVLYSMPPMRLSYRPFLGEWAALFPTMIAGVALGGLAATDRLSLSLMSAMGWYGVFCVASVMQHHFTDLESDWGAHPRKQTTPAWWMFHLNRNPKELVFLYELVAFGVAFISRPMNPGGFTVALAATGAAMLVTLTTSMGSGIKALTLRDLAIKVLVPVAMIMILFIHGAG